MATKTSSAAEHNDFFKPDYFKVPDFGQFSADFNRWVSDFSKSFANGKAPSVDLETLFASQRKNFEAFASANQLAFDGVKAVAQRQAELARESVEEFSKLAKELTVPASAEEKLAKQAEIAKAAFEQSLATMREMTETLQKSNTQAIDVISKRVADSFDEVKTAFAKSAKK
ncbi:MAG TPA: TIGR01841 family phasin [Candidatus Binatia bacterium]|nr:TIGR01841 family phasin [Candidatus Binatia bacterium]